MGVADAQFSILTGPGHIRPHCGPSNARLNLALPLLQPEAAELRVGPPPGRKYRRGEVLVSDDSFEHEVRHDGSGPFRAVLLVSVEHPTLAAQLGPAMMTVPPRDAQTGGESVAPVRAQRLLHVSSRDDG